MSMTAQIRVDMVEDDLIMKAQEPWVLDYPFAGVGGKNPRAFQLCGFRRLDEALSKAKKLVEKYGSENTSIGLLTDLLPDKYELLRPQLNDLWKGGWTGTIYGTLDKEARAILGGAETTTFDGARIPAFIWYATKDEIEVYGSVLVEGKDRYLEIATEEGDRVNLLDQVAFLDDVQFDYVTENP